MKNTKNVTTTSGKLSVEQVREMIANSQASLKESIRQLNYKRGLPLSGEEREELLSVVIYKALLAADTYNPQLSQVKTWLSRIASNEIDSYLKRRALQSSVCVKYIDECDDDGCFDDRIRQMHYRLDEAESQKVGFLGVERDRESLLKVECLNDAILSLSERDQKAVCYRLQGMSGREMAERLGISEAAQRKLISDMRGRLGKKMQMLHYADIADCTDRYRDCDVRLDEAKDEMFGFVYASRSEMDD